MSAACGSDIGDWPMKMDRRGGSGDVCLSVESNHLDDDRRPV